MEVCFELFVYQNFDITLNKNSQFILVTKGILIGKFFVFNQSDNF